MSLNATSATQTNNSLQNKYFRFLISTPCVAFLASRLWCGLFVYLGHANHPYLSDVIGGYHGVENWWLNPWTTFDTLSFFEIARDGYNSRTAAFFPLYPWALRLAGTNYVAIALWGTLLSNACFFFALFYFHRLTAREYSQTLAYYATWLLAFFPTTAYFSAVYTDAMFLLFFVLCFWNIRQEKWAMAGVWALLAAMTRNAAPLLFIGLLLEYLRSRKVAGSATYHAAAWWAVAAPLIGFAIAQGFIVSQVGDVMRGVTSQEEYFRALMFPLIPIWRDIKDVATGSINAITCLHLGATLLAFYFAVRYWKRQPKSYSVMTIGLMLMHLTLGHTTPPYTLPSARYLSTMFPFTQCLAHKAQPLFQTRFHILLFAILYLTLCAVISYEFGRKTFVG